MALPYHPTPGTIVVCDYTTGFREPEMIKRRLAVTISPKLKRRNDLVTVIPLSSTPPREAMDWHHEIDLVIAPPWGNGRRWAKCDMLATVGYERLNLPHTRHAVTGQRTYIQIELPDADVEAIRSCLKVALGLTFVGH